MNMLIRVMGGNYTVMLLVTSALTMILLGFALQRSSVNPQYSLFVYYGLFGYLNSFNIMRQFVAISFVLLAISYYRQKLKCGMFLLTACGFHSSAIIAFSIFFIPFLKFRKNNIYVMLFVTILVGCVLNDAVFNLLAGDYARYLTSDTDGYRDNPMSAFIMAMMMDFLFIWIYITAKTRVKKSIWMKVFFLGILLVNLTFKLELGTRLILYLTMSQIFVFPYFLKYNNEKTKIIPDVLIFVYCLVIFTKIFLGCEADLVPYKMV